MVESGKTTLSSQIVQLPDTPTNFHRPITSRSTELAKSLNPFPQLPQRERIQYDSVNHVSRTYVYSIHQASSRFLHSKCFSKISPLQIPTMSKDLVRIWIIRNKSSETWIPSKNQISLRSDHLFVRYKYSNFHVFQEFRFPPPTPPNVTGSGRNLKLEL